ncbi:MerR family transcriptional regulator [Lactobacillus mellis]|nr:MerR family transcriptional regulator [Bombilactobacillus mellis]
MKISEVAKKVNLSPVTLRYYEKIGLIPPVQRQQGVREYRIEDLNWINFIKCLRQVQIPIKDLKSSIQSYFTKEKRQNQRGGKF